jgi:hypothetical protein
LLESLSVSWRRRVSVHGPISRRLNDSPQQGKPPNLAIGQSGDGDRPLDCSEQLTTDTSAADSAANGTIGSIGINSLWSIDDLDLSSVFCYCP